MRYKILAWTFVLMAIAALASAIYRWQVVNSIPTYGPIIHRDQTANWKTYTNTEYGFEFKYDGAMYSEIPPSEDNSILRVKNIAYFKPQNIEESVSVYITDIKTTICTNTAIDITVSSGAWKYCIFAADAPENYRYYRAMGENEAIVFQTFDNNLSENTIKPILSTFKLSSSAETANWKTYTNTEFGFEIKMPSGWEAEIPPERNAIYFISLELNASQIENNKNCDDAIAGTLPAGKNCIPEMPRADMGFGTTSTLEMDIKDYNVQVSEETFNGVVFKIHPAFGLFGQNIFETIHNGKIYRFDMYNEPIGRQILSTFKFTK